MKKTETSHKTTKGKRLSFGEKKSSLKVIEPFRDESRNMNDILVLRDVSASYRKSNIIEKVNCNVKKGDFIAVTGKSGSGKSTLLYVLGGFLRPSTGLYLFENKRVYRGIAEIGLGTFRRKNIGYLFQDFRLLPFLTIEQNIQFPIYFSGEKLHKERVRFLLDLFGLEHRSKAYPGSISGGEAQRTALARALMLEPKLLLLDEPTGNLDLDTESEIIHELIKLKKRGFTLICVTHSPRIRECADIVWHLENGKMLISQNSGKKKKPV
ncbi:MAG: ATP-binding cassette domain-containing protein [Spirochaetia bacterium]|nr:ATP-binding cassette domain-containing protein [Spirochaetia bacterium]